MPHDLGLEHLLKFGQALNMVDVGVRRHQHLALRKGKVKLPNELDNFVDRLVIAHVNQQPLRSVVDQVDIAPEALAGLHVHFDNVRKYRLPFQHDSFDYVRLAMSRLTGSRVYFGRHPESSLPMGSQVRSTRPHSRFDVTDRQAMSDHGPKTALLAAQLAPFAGDPSAGNR